MTRGLVLSKKIYQNFGLIIQILGPILAFNHVGDKVVSEVAAFILFAAGTLILVLSGFYRRSDGKEE